MEGRLKVVMDQVIKADIRRLAREGRLIEQAFQIFHRMVFPGAPPDQVDAMRICFFAGAGEIFALCMASLDAGDDATQGDMNFMDQWVRELEQFHERTIAASKAGPGGHA